MSEVTICNIALGWVGGNRITSLDLEVDNSKEAQLCSDNYPGLRDAVLEEGGWNFATKRFALTPLAEEPVSGFNNQFLIPQEVLRVIRLSDLKNDINQSGSIKWRVEQDTIQCNAETIYIKCIVRITDTTKFSAGMVQSLAARLAMDLATPIARSNSLMQSMTQLYTLKMRNARSIENMQGTSEKLLNISISAARFHSGYTSIGPVV